MWRPFGPGGKQQISTSVAGCREAGAAKNFYLTRENKLMAEVNGQGRVGCRSVAAAVRRPSVRVRLCVRVTADGRRFLVNTAVEQKASAPITLVQNWTADFKR